MRKTRVKSPQRETATTARDEDQDRSLRGAPSGLKCELRASPGQNTAEDAKNRTRASILSFPNVTNYMRKNGGTCGARLSTMSRTRLHSAEERAGDAEEEEEERKGRLANAHRQSHARAHCP